VAASTCRRFVEPFARTNLVFARLDFGTFHQSADGNTRLCSVVIRTEICSSFSQKNVNWNAFTLESVPFCSNFVPVRPYNLILWSWNLTTPIVKSSVFWDVVPYGLVEIHVSRSVRAAVNERRGGIFLDLLHVGKCGNVVVKGLWYKPEGRGFETRWGEIFLSIYLIILAALDPNFVQLLTKINNKYKNNVSVE
jgi:hypothetical protein